jgi:hypothetical protein
MSRAADNHYPTLTTAAIAAIDVPAALDCVLFLWATVAMKDDARHVMKCWGFDYKSTYYWHKPGHYWSTRDQIEELLMERAVAWRRLRLVHSRHRCRASLAAGTARRQRRSRR